MQRQRKASECDAKAAAYEACADLKIYARPYKMGA